ncbi:MAG: AMP-binding protein [Bryobacteraceae bacterium]
MNLTTLFDLSLKGRSEMVALESGDRQLTFADLDARANRVARLLQQRGLARGDRLCVYLSNCIEIIDLFLACTRTGVIFVPINILYREREITHILHDAEPKAVVSDAPGIPALADIWPPGEIAAAADGEGEEAVAEPLDGDSPAAIVYTSGTTGVSKGAVLTHNNFASNAVNLVNCWQISAQDRLLLALPLFHVHALGNGIPVWLMSGCRVRLLDRFEHQSAANEFLRFRPSLFYGVPTMYVRLLDWTEETARFAGGYMRLFVSGSAPLPAQVLEEFEVKFGHRILERYGMTETLMNLSNPYEGERRAGTVGMPLPGVSVKIVNGELYVKGPNVFSGYWRREEATRDAFADGWFRTGDMGSCSPDGYYTLEGRKTDLIISGGFNIYPREIEELLLEDPAVAEAAVAAIPDRVRGELPVAFIVPRDAFDASRLEALCRSKLASFKMPRAFVRVDALPRNAMGKIQKHLLPKAEVEPE